MPAFLEARRLITPSAELVAEPLAAFLWLPVPVSAPSPSDAGLAFSRAVMGGETPAAVIAVQAFSIDGDQAPVVVAADSREIHRVDGAGPALQLGLGTATAGDSPMTLLPLDWNHDFQMDLVAAGAHGIRLFIQGPSGQFADETARASSRTGSPILDVAAAWAADIEMDGDIDIVAGIRNGPRDRCSGTTATAHGWRRSRLPESPVFRRSRGVISTTTAIRMPRSWTGQASFVSLPTCSRGGSRRFRHRGNREASAR